MQLNETYRITKDENNVILQFHENRERNKKDGTVEVYEFVDNWYYPSVKMALKSFLNKSVDQAGSVKEVLDKIEEAERRIDNL